MHARSALFDLYGDHLLDRGGWAPISACVGLLGSLGISAPAVRTAVSRMVGEGWLEPLERDQRGYAVSARGRERLSEAHARIYRTEPAHWDGQWHLVVVERTADRNVRARSAQALAFLGYGRLSGDTWIAPRPSRELDSVLAGAGVRWSGFTGSAQGDAREVVARVWDLESLAEAYREFQQGTLRAGAVATPEEAFVVRSTLVHEWRLFLFRDPGLPDEVLPTRWPGRDAARRFDTRARELLPGARDWVDTWLDGAARS